MFLKTKHISIWKSFLIPSKNVRKPKDFLRFQDGSKGDGGMKRVDRHCVKSVRIRSFSGPYFPAFGLNTERYSASLRIQSEGGKMWTRKTPNRDTFHAVRIPLEHLNVLTNSNNNNNDSNGKSKLWSKKVLYILHLPYIYIYIYIFPIKPGYVHLGT